LALLRVGLAEPDRSPDPLVSSYLTVSPLPQRGGLFSVALSAGRPAWVLPSTLPFGARTFLERLRPRSPGRLLRGTSIRAPYHRRTMRPASLLIATVLAVGGCAPQPDGPAAPIAVEQLGEAPALEASAARAAVVDFVSAYAASPTEGVGALAQSVASPELDTWVRWLDVQHREFDGAIDAVADVRDVEFVGSLEEDRARAQVALSASVVFHIDPDGDDAFESVRILDGAVTLMRTDDAATYKVFDLQRDGVRMSEAIESFRDEVRTEQQVKVQLDSLFMFPPNWQFNMVIRNDASEPLFLDANSTGLYVEEGNGFDRIPAVISGSFVVVPPASEVEGILAFRLQPTASGRVLTLAYRLGRRDRNQVLFEFPLEGLVTSVPPPPPADQETEGDVTT
jgi:hypothetical protein